MGSNTKAADLLNHIGNELKLLWCQMDAYQELFLLKAEKRQSLLQKTAPGFFAITQVSLVESILMRVFRLMDPTKSCGDENSSIQHLRDVLSNVDVAQVALRTCITNIRSDWQAANGSYVALRATRNKFLGHNDFAKHAALEPNQLWMNLSMDEFKSTQRLAGCLWAMYRQCSRVLRNTDVVEPTHDTLDNRPAMLLKQLCSSLYLDHLLGDERYTHAGAEQAFELEHMGEDCVRPVFEEGQK